MFDNISRRHCSSRANRACLPWLPHYTRQLRPFPHARLFTLPNLRSTSTPEDSSNHLKGFDFNFFLHRKVNFIHTYMLRERKTERNTKTERYFYNRLINFQRRELSKTVHNEFSLCCGTIEQNIHTKISHGKKPWHASSPYIRVAMQD